MHDMGQIIMANVKGVNMQRSDREIKESEEQFSKVAVGPQ